MSDTNATQPVEAHTRREEEVPDVDRLNRMDQIYQGVRDMLQKLVGPFINSLLPEPHYLEGENIQQVIRMAPYRLRFPKIVILVSLVLLIPSAGTFIGALILMIETVEMIAGGLTVLSGLLLWIGLQEWLDYHQWQFIITDKRIILITPDPQRENFADAIYLKRGKIQVLDTNFSRNAVWGLYQIITGSRDVMLSMAGYEFFEQGAQVKGGLRFPDVVPEDITKLEQLIFG